MNEPIPESLIQIGDYLKKAVVLPALALVIIITGIIWGAVEYKKSQEYD